MSCIRYILNWWAYRPRRCQRCQNHLHSYRVRCEGCGRWIGPACHPERCWAIEAIQFCHRTLCRDCWREWPSRRLRLLKKEPPLPLRIVLNHGWLALTRPPPVDGSLRIVLDLRDPSQQPWGRGTVLEQPRSQTRGPALGFATGCRTHLA